MQSPDSPSSTSSSSPSINDTEATEATETEDVPVPPPSPLKSADDFAESESKLDENDIPLPSSPSSSKIDDTRTELLQPPAESSEPQPDTEQVDTANRENVDIVEKKDASTQTEIVATETNINNSTATLTSTISTSGLPFISGEHPVMVGSISSTSKQHERDLQGLNTALGHTVFDYTNLTFMNEEKNASNEDCCSESANQWRDTMSAADYDDERRDHSHQNPCPCFLPNEQDAVSGVPQWYHPPMQIPNYASATPPSQMPSYQPPSQPMQMPSYPQPSQPVQMPNYPQASPHPMQALPAYQYYPPYSNYGMYYNNRAGCYYPNSGGLTQCGHPSCYEGERPYWWNMNGRRWPESKDDLCSFGCGRRRRCRREYYLESPRPRPRSLHVKTIMKETTEKNNDHEAFE